MARSKNDEDKIRETFLIKIKHRKMDQKVKINEWVKAQSNFQASMVSLIEHMIDRFGNEDITDHLIAKKLHTEMLYFNNNVLLNNHNEINVGDSLKTESNEVQEESEDSQNRAKIDTDIQTNKQAGFDPEAY